MNGFDAFQGTGPVCSKSERIHPSIFWTGSIKYNPVRDIYTLFSFIFAPEPFTFIKESEEVLCIVCSPQAQQKSLTSVGKTPLV